MDAVLALLIAVYLAMVAGYVYSAVTDDWGRFEGLGGALALVGLWIVLFTDDAIAVLALDVPVLVEWGELLGATILLVGVLVKRHADSTPARIPASV